MHRHAEKEHVSTHADCFTMIIAFVGFLIYPPTQRVVGGVYWSQIVCADKHLWFVGLGPEPNTIDSFDLFR